MLLILVWLQPLAPNPLMSPRSWASVPAASPCLELRDIVQGELWWDLTGDTMGCSDEALSSVRWACHLMASHNLPWLHTTRLCIPGLPAPPAALPSLITWRFPSAFCMVLLVLMLNMPNPLGFGGTGGFLSLVLGTALLSHIGQICITTSSCSSLPHVLSFALSRSLIRLL